MNTVIAIHNNMNENTWSQVLEWEKLRNPYVASYTSSTITTTTPSSSSLVDTGRESKLLRFMGKPDDYSPKARIKMLFGHPPPFDRHDWIVDRGGIEVRYVIDYYHDESSIQIDKIPSKLTDASSIQSIKVDVRPALDSISAFIDRLLIMPWKQLKKETNYYPPPFFPPSKMIIAEQQKYSRIQQNWSEIASKCVEKKEKLALCSTDEDCRVASVALQICTASIICPSIAQAFIQCTSTATSNSNHDNTSKDNNSNNNNIMILDNEKFQKAGAAYSSLVQCLELFEADSLKVLNAKKK
jgi:cytochrome c heme-lyase